MSNKQMTPEEELVDLCDVSVVGGVAIVSELSPGAEYSVDEDFSTLVESLRLTPDLNGLLFDGLTSVHRPGILKDGVVFYNATEVEMLKHLEIVERHDHVHWMFNQLMEIQGKCYEKWSAALPNILKIHSIDSDSLHRLSERLLRVIVQSAKVKIAASKKSLEEEVRGLQKTLDGLGKLKEVDLQEKLHKLEVKRSKQAADRAKKRVQETDREIAQVKADMTLLARYLELETKRKVFKEREDEKHLQETEVEFVKVERAIGLKEQGLTKALLTMTAERETLTGVNGKQDERDALDQEIVKCAKEIEAIKGQVESITSKMAELAEEGKNYREPETSPVYQRRVAEHVKQLYKRFYQLGEKYGIRIVTKPEILVFGKIAFLYEHSTGRTWAPSPISARRLAESYHGLMDEVLKDVTARLKEMDASVHDIDAVVVGGHDGAFMARWQKLNLTPEEIRMDHVNTFFTGESDGVKHILFLSCMPWEAQDRIAPYLNREKPARTRAGKPINSAADPVFERYSKRAVSGAQILRKHQNGHLSVEAIMYDLYRTKEILAPFKAVMSQDDSDQHFGSPEMDALGTLGTLALIDRLMKRPLKLYGTEVYIGAKFMIGDAGEGSSKAWKEAYKFRRQVMEVIEEIPRRLVATDKADYESVLKTTIAWANDMMGGANENLRLTAEVVSWVCRESFLRIYHQSPARLRDILLILEGNHYANSNRDGGHREFDPFKDWLMAKANHHRDFPEDRTKPFPLKIIAGGEPQLQHLPPDTAKPEIVVHLGGYSVSRQAIIEEFGVGHDGKLLVQKPYRLGFTHEPNALENKAASHQADVEKAGHTHEKYVRIVKTSDNRGRFLDQKACTQRVSATELLYGGIPRTAGIDLCVYTQPGRYFVLFIPMQHMRRIGLAWLKTMAKRAVDQKMGAPKDSTPAQKHPRHIRGRRK